GSPELYVCGDPACTTGTKRTLGVADPAIPEGWEGYFTSIAIGDDGNPVISHGGPFSGLHLYVCDDPTCTTGTNRTLVTADYLENGVRVGGHTSIAIGVDGNPVISHTAELTDGPNLNVAIAVFAVTGIAFE
ncbi:MAG: hypothetical protein ACPHK6_11035, partial [Ilumatobacteraceae bacterium]